MGGPGGCVAKSRFMDMCVPLTTEEECTGAESPQQQVLSDPGGLLRVQGLCVGIPAKFNLCAWDGSRSSCEGNDICLLDFDYPGMNASSCELGIESPSGDAIC